MCGIVGWVNFDGLVDLDKLSQVTDTLHHRGPDSGGTFLSPDGKVALGHRRLSILDVSERGNQPMGNEEGTVQTTVNGEVYNFKTLRSQLAGRYRFVSNSDSEIILRGYQEWGLRSLIDKIDGMYAFAIYDSTQRKIYLVRDRIGIKPLYYADLGNEIVWASELKAISIFAPGLSADYTAVYDYLTYGYVPSPKTMYKGVYKLPPAHYLEIGLEDRDLRSQAYWFLDADAQQKWELDDAASTLTQLISKSVREQLMSDVPLGFFLSGGMDSSVVVAEARKTASKVHTYSIGFDVKSHDETAYAGLVARRFATDHRTEILSERDAEKLFPNMRSWYDEPFADTSALPTYLVARFARQTSTVVLTGDGGDEVFGGYAWYPLFAEKSRLRLRNALLRRLFVSSAHGDRLIAKVARRLRFPFLDDLETYTVLMGGLLKEEKTHYARAYGLPSDYDDYWHFRTNYRMDLPVLTRLQYLDFHTYLPDDILTKVDRVSMAVSLEARVPLLSKELVEFCFSLPESLRFHGGEMKGLLKYAYRKVLPTEVLQREKKGFSVPQRSWTQLFDDSRSKQEQILQGLFADLAY